MMSAPDPGAFVPLRRFSPDIRVGVVELISARQGRSGDLVGAMLASVNGRLRNKIN
jgi:hypothetical protein